LAKRVAYVSLNIRTLPTADIIQHLWYTSEWGGPGPGGCYAKNKQTNKQTNKQNL